jgi:thiol-disulfide isomerase/thioredoxin
MLSVASVAGLAASSSGVLATPSTIHSHDISPLDVSGSGNGSSHDITVYFFYGNGCPHCAVAEPVIDGLSEKYPQVNFERLEIYDNSTNQALFQQFNSRYGVQNPVVPEVYVGDKVLIAEDEIRNDLEPEVQRLLSTNDNGTENNNPINTSAGNANDTRTDNASNAAYSPSNNSSMPAGPNRTGYENTPDPIPSETIEIGVILAAAAAVLIIGYIVYRKRRN